MLPAAERLRRSNVFQRAYSAKKSASTSLLTLYLLERQQRSNPRLPLTGFVIGKKVFAKSNKRNKAKRRIREAYRLVRRNAEITQALEQWYAIVIVIRAEVLTAAFDDLCRSMSECILKAAGKYGKKNAQTKRG